MSMVLKKLRLLRHKALDLGVASQAPTMEHIIR